MNKRNESTSRGDFERLLEGVGIRMPSTARSSDGSSSPVPSWSGGAHGTTVIAIKFDDGVLNVADRRATAATGILYDEAEKLLKLDDSTLIAIAGSFAQASEAARFLRHSFKYYARSQLQELSLEGKLAEVTKLLSQNLPSAMQGIGGFLPVISAYDRHEQQGRVFFYDVLGARFESREVGAAGSGAEKIRGTFDYIVRTRGPFHEMPLGEVLRESLLLLDIAAGLDPATSGLKGVPPLAKTVTAAGVEDVPQDQMVELQHEIMETM